MERIGDFKIREIISHNERTIIYRVVDENEHSKIAKGLSSGYYSKNDIINLRYEYEILKKLIGVPYVSQTIIPWDIELNQFILFEDFHGISLQQYTKKEKLSILELLTLSKKIAIGIDSIHRKNIIHKDINPTNILIHPESKEIQIIDFGISSISDKKSKNVQNLSSLEGTLAYISPEQTGRVNRQLDHRTDFYSIGITFYELFTGNRPFSSDDDLELVHSHIAVTPKSPNSLNDAIPEILSLLIMKLISKNADDRYQTATGLIYDLEKIEIMLKGKEHKLFLLGEKDISSKFLISQKIYGRQKEIKILDSAFEHVLLGNIALSLVYGISGLGKTTLVNEFYKNLSLENIFSLNGNFEKHQINVPYHAFIKILSGFCDRILIMPSNEIEKWKEKILTACGNNGKVLIDFIPKFQLLIGEQPALSELSSKESQNRFFFVLLNFLKAIASKDSPVIFFLDEFQWADSASLFLLNQIFQTDQLKYLYIICAFHENEPDSNFSIFDFVNEVEKEKILHIDKIKLSHLSIDNTHELLIDTFSCDRETSLDLNQIIYQKTEGNPFFIKEFLETLYEDEDIFFNPDHQKWEWNFGNIKNKEASSNVFENIRNKIMKQSESVREILMIIASTSCFSLSGLIEITNRSLSGIIEDLNVLIENEFIFSINNEHKIIYNLITEFQKEDFSHLPNFEYVVANQKILSITAESIEESKRQHIHLNLARYISNHKSPSEKKNAIFEIAFHYNESLPLIFSETERINVAEINLSAAKKAKSSSAFESTLSFLKKGLAILPQNSWIENYELSFSLNRDLAEAYYLNNDFEQSEEFCFMTIKNARTNIEQAEIYNLLIFQYTMLAKYKNAVDVGTTSLVDLNFPLPLQDIDEEINNSFSKINKLLKNVIIENIIDNQQLEN